MSSVHIVYNHKTLQSQVQVKNQYTNHEKFFTKNTTL